MAGLSRPSTSYFPCAWPEIQRMYPMIARNELWDELEKSLRSLANSISSTELDKHSRDLLDEFVENREYGVALEWLHSLIVDRSIQLSLQQEKEIQRLAQLMEIDLS